MIERVEAHDFDELREAWTQLYVHSASQSLFSTHVWLRQWLRHFGRDHAAIVEREGEVLVAATVLHFAGETCHHIEDHTYWAEVLHRQDRRCPRRGILTYLHEQRFERVFLEARQDSSAAEELFRESVGLYEVTPRFPHTMHAVDVGQSFEAYLASRRGKVRSELRRKSRKFSRNSISEQLASFEPGDECPIDAVFAIEAASWKERAETAIISSEQELAFYREVLTMDEDGARGRAYLLMGDGEPRAFVLGVVYGGCFYALKTSYREEDKKLSPGQVIFYRLIEALCSEEGITRLELLGRDSRWKRELATESYTMCGFELERQSLLARARKLARLYVAPRVREAMHDNPQLARAVGRAREALSSVRRVVDRRSHERDGT